MALASFLNFPFEIRSQTFSLTNLSHLLDAVEIEE